MCRLMTENVEDKNPLFYDFLTPAREDYGRTPYHEAAAHGHLQLCQHFIDILENKNPPNECGTTPLHLAAQFGHSPVAHLILGN